MSQAASSTWRERLNSPLTLHSIGFAVLFIIATVLAARVFFDWAAIDRNAEESFQGRQVELKAQELQTAPLRDLDKKVAVTREEMRRFYDDRIPPSYSSIAGRIDELSVKSGVRLTRVQYTQGAPGSYLTEISMDAGISGDYPQIMRFINSLERDQTLFVIRAMALTGQSGGLVNLRLRVSTWLRPAAAAASGLPATPTEGPQGANTPAPPEER